MLHRGHRGRGMFPSSKMTTVSRTCRCRKCTRISVLVAARPGHPSTGQICGPPLDGKAMDYVCGSSPVDEVFQLRLSSAACPCCFILWPINDPSAISPPTIPELHPFLLLLPVGGSLSCHPSPVRRLRLGPSRLEWAADHVNCLPNIIPHDHPIEQDDQGTKCTLEPSWVQRCNHAIVNIEEGILMPTLLSMLTPIRRALYYNRHPVSHYHIHHHIEYGVRERISLRHSTSSLKRHPVVAACPFHHCQTPPICLEEPTGSGAHAVTFQDIKVPGPAQGFIRLVQIQEYQIQDILPKGR